MIDDVTPSGQGLAEPFDIAGRHPPSGRTAALTFNAEDYLPLLSEIDLTDEQARELLLTLWNIMRACVELGIRVDVCGELGLDALSVLSNEAEAIG